MISPLPSALACAIAKGSAPASHRTAFTQALHEGEPATPHRCARSRGALSHASIQSRIGGDASRRHAETEKQRTGPRHCAITPSAGACFTLVEPGLGFLGGRDVAAPAGEKRESVILGVPRLATPVVRHDDTSEPRPRRVGLDVIGRAAAGEKQAARCGYGVGPSRLNGLWLGGSSLPAGSARSCGVCFWERVDKSKSARLRFRFSCCALFWSIPREASTRPLLLLPPPASARPHHAPVRLLRLVLEGLFFRGLPRWLNKPVVHEPRRHADITTSPRVPYSAFPKPPAGIHGGKPRSRSPALPVPWGRN